ncbi:MAG: hypothetical protein AAGM29_13425, partial [Cyanobacteria bacterium J06588_4]
MKSQPWLTIAGIAICSLLIDTPQSLAHVRPRQTKANPNIEQIYAYNLPSELAVELQKQEKNISCRDLEVNSQLTHFQTWI